MEMTQSMECGITIMLKIAKGNILVLIPTFEFGIFVITI